MFARDADRKPIKEPHAIVENAMLRSNRIEHLSGAVLDDPMRINERGTSLNINQIITARRTEILRMAAEHGAMNVRVFGSVARASGS